MSVYAPAAEAATKVITFLANSESEVGISEISRGVNLNKNMVFRILNSLEKEGWVYCENQKYSLTLLPFKLASRSISKMVLNTAALPSLYKLHAETGESVYLGVLCGYKVMYLQHLDGVKDVRVAGRVGGEYDLYCSAPGKALLAYAEKSFIDEYTCEPLTKRTQNTIVDKALLNKELENIKTRGYATDCEEFGNGIACAAAPIFDYTGAVIGAIGCSTFVLNSSAEETLKDVIPKVKAAAADISLKLGYR